MLLLALASISLLTTEPATSFGSPRGIETPRAVACGATTRQAVSGTYLDNARRFVADGDLESARREYRIATMLELDNGCLSEASSTELASVLLAQSRAHDAADVMRRLAEDAARHNDVNVEARARVASAWLRLDAGDQVGAKPEIRRLHALAKDPRLTSATRRLIAESLG